jgi:(1->4)-alpha-D-glucan 1-alpha-D-glucosylmutase
MVKAVREAMVHTRWTVPNLDHEQALTNFVAAILEDRPANQFLHDFKRVVDKIAYHGALNSLSQLLIKLASPGAADFYQGTEVWDFRLVDPDNRQPVNFAQREELLATANEPRQSLTDLLGNWRNGRIKMFATQRGLCFRRRHAALFLKGAYVPLHVEGPLQECVIAFARRHRGAWSTVIVPRFTTRFAADGRLPFNAQAWNNTRIVLPKDAPKSWVNVLSDEPSDASDAGELFVSNVLRTFPAALLASEGIIAGG